jgi:hypothetical protein
MDIKENFYAKLDEISGAKARKAEHKSAEKYYDAYDDETRTRRKAIKDKTPESKEAAEKAKEKREKAAKRTIRFQNYADKKEKKEIKEGLKMDDYGHNKEKAKKKEVVQKFAKNIVDIMKKRREADKKKKKLDEARSDDDNASIAVQKTKAKHMLKDAEKSGKKKSQEWLNKMVKRKNQKV